MGYEPPRPRTLLELLPKEQEDAALTTLRDGGESGPVEVARSWTYAELDAAVAELRGALSDAGLARGHVVSMGMGNTAEFVCAFLAVTGVAAIAAPLNPAYTRDEFAFYVDDARANVVLVESDVADDAAVVAAAQKLNVPVWRVSAGADGHFALSTGSAAPLQRESIVAESGEESARAPHDAVSEDDAALFLHTSGTTSRPKGVPLTHKNLTTSVRNIANTYELRRCDRTLLVMPLFHVHGLMAALLSTLATGGEVVIPPGGRFSASRFWPSVHLRNVTWYTAVPTIHQVLLQVADKQREREGGGAEGGHHHGSHGPARLRFIRSCSSALAPATLEAVERTFRAKVLEAYAMTEAAHQMCSNPLHGERRAGSVGCGTGVEVAILDGDARPRGAGEVGEVCVRGDNVTSGYVNASAETNREAFAGGWFHTGDQGWLSEDGYVTLTGRIKELINRGGEKISPLEIDAALLDHPAVAEAVSFGAPDDKYGEEVNAAVVLKKKEHSGGSGGGEAADAPGAEQLQHFCKEHLSAFKVPKKIFFSNELPRTATGKIQRRIVASHFLDDKKHSC